MSTWCTSVVRTCVVALAVGLLCGCSTSTSIRPQTTATRPARAADDVFVARGAAAAPSMFHSTGLVDGSTINTAVLEQMVKQRLSQVENAALNDLLKQAAASVGSEPVTDLLQALGSLLVALTDGEARSQTLTSALIRDGISVGIALLAESKVLDRDGCTPSDADLKSVDPAQKDTQTQWLDIKVLSNAAYEGLAVSTTFRSLGFPEATGKPPVNCVAFSADVAKLVDTVANMGLDASAADGLASAVTKATSSCKAPAAAGAPDPKTPAALQASLAQIPGNVDNLAISTLNDLQTAFSNGGSFYMSAIAAAQDPAPQLACYTAISQLVSRAKVLTGSLKTSIPLTVADLKSALGVLTKLKGPNIDSLVNQQDMQLLQSIGAQIVQQKPLQPGDIISLTKWIQKVWQGERPYVSSEVARDVIDATLDIVPQAVRTDSTAPAGVRLDVPALVSTAVSKYGNENRKGVYARATIGAGYLTQQASGINRFGPSFYEELGAGYRWGGTKVLTGPHVAASGILYDITTQQGTQNAAFLGAGWSVNLYQLIDASVTTGCMVDVGASGVSNPRWALFAGLQLPLLDYINALTSPGTTETQTTTASTTK